MSNFRESYPIDFDLYDKDTQNVLYIEDTSDQLLTLHIENASTETIQLDNLTDVVSNSNYHFALRFRPGTLSPVSLGEVSGNSIQLATDTALNWEMATPETDAAGMDVIYLRSTTTDLSLDPGTLQTIVFENVGADAGQGARGTRVELLYTNMTYSGGSETISGTREIHLSVINHRGKQNLPLHVGFVGDNAVLNDGTANSLTLRFSNTMVYDATNPDISALTFLHDADETLRSKIILSFDVGTAAEEWALSDWDNINTIVITQPNDWVITEDTSGQSPEWILYPDTANGDQVLYGKNDPDTAHPEYFDLGISNIVTEFPTGYTYLYIRYENIPGYWDGQMKVAIEKRPLVYYDDSNDNRNVGIGTSSPSEKLEVDGNAKITGELYIDSGSNAVIHYGNRGKLGEATAFNPDDDNNGLWIEGSNDDESGGIFMNGNTLSIWSPGDNDLLRVYDEDYFTGDPRFKIDYVGNVGIGDTNPLAPLSIGQTGYPGSGKEASPDDSMHITNDCILFGGNNSGKEINSAQISAGKHVANSLNIVGMGTSDSNRKVNIWAEGGLNVSGNVGIGDTDPLAPLSISTAAGQEDSPDDSMHITNDCILFGGNNSGRQKDSAQISAGKHVADSLNIVGMGTSDSNRKVNIWAEGGLTVSGKVGIGANNAGNAFFEVSGYIFRSETNSVGYLSPNGAGVEKDGLPNNYAIYTPHTIGAYNYVAHSDRRIKNIQGISNGAEDLQTLLSIEITDYLLKDTIANGNQPHKKVIGQQVFEVFPQAVSKSVTEVVPDIYRQANVQGGWVMLETDLEIGQRVKIITDDKEEIHGVSEAEANRFRLAAEALPKEIFVYGREVNDFHVIDYEAISMLNVSATQELYRKLEAQQQLIETLTKENKKKELQELAKRLDTLEMKNA